MSGISSVLESINLLLQSVDNNSALIADENVGHILDLQHHLQTLKAQLEDFCRHHPHDIVFGPELMVEIRNVISEAADAVDNYLLRAGVVEQRSSRNWWLPKAFRRITSHTDSPKLHLLDLGKDAKRIGQQIENINRRGMMNGIQKLEYLAVSTTSPPPEAESLSQQLRKELPLPEGPVIGFDEAAEDVVELLTIGPEQLEIISIVGMGGIGKTTLAQMVYKDPNVDYEFMIRSFVVVTQHLYKKQVLLKILASFTIIFDEVREMGEAELERYVHQQLEGKQYLVVLDDVWRQKDWDDLKNAFPNNHKRCRVLITTRYGRVATYANPSPEFCYMLNFLPYDKCIELLRWNVFKENECPEELQAYVVEIAKKCDGLPLAILTMASVITRDRYKVEHWRDVARGVKEHIASDTSQVSKIIDLSYKHLPYQLKLCFLYLGMFREDLEIPVWKLMRLWIAEDFIQQQGNLKLEDLSEEYLEELVDRNLVMVGQRRSNGRIKTCRIHDTVHAFCRHLAAKDNLFQETNDNNPPSVSSGDARLELCRRLCANNIRGGVDSIRKIIQSGERLHSFLTFHREKLQVERRLGPSLIKPLKLVKVLEVGHLNFTRFPVDMCRLLLLKYIAMSSEVELIPESLSALSNLQTLIVLTTSFSLDIKADIWKMPQFRHLHTNASAILPSPLPDHISSDQTEKGPKFQTLSTISSKSCTREVVKRIPQVRKLGILGRIETLFESDSFDNLRNLEFLENLKLFNDNTTDSKLHRLPSETSFPQNLKEITLRQTRLGWREMSTLGKLEYLEVLKLKEDAFEGKLWVTEGDGFGRLKHLHIGRTDLEVWETEGDHFPKLMTLKLGYCEKLLSLPIGLVDITDLEEIILHCTNTAVASQARRIQAMKLEQARKANKTTNFRLSVYPPGH